MKKIIDVTGKLDITMDAREWCKLSYPGHKNGCPNYGERETCPPKIKTIYECFDLSKQHWLAVVSFDLAAHVERLKEIHPDWSERQLFCCLYWQGSVRKQLKELCEDFVKNKSEICFSNCPEAMGINVFTTLSKFDVKLTKNPKNIVYKVALIGYPKEFKK